MINPKTEYDSPWKEILEIYFEDFISFFFPYLHGEIDWTKNIEFLDKELRQVTSTAKRNSKFKIQNSKFKMNTE